VFELAKKKAGAAIVQTLRMPQIAQVMALDAMVIIE
jgi:hypothetical protein